MTTKQGDPALMRDPVAQKLLHSTLMAHLAYVWEDGTPRVEPIWFHWNEHEGEIVFGTLLKAPKVHVLPNRPEVAITIDSDTWPYKVLLMRGTASIEMIDGMVPEYELAVCRYFGEEQGHAWAANALHLSPRMVRIAVRPTWVGILDFEQRFPSAMEAAMEAAA